MDFASLTAMSCLGALAGGWLADATGLATLSAWGPLATAEVLWAALRAWTARPQPTLGASSTAL